MIYIITHKKCKLPDKAKDFTVLQVGAEEKEELGFLKDNVNDNISELNPYFCELTGIYWVWKHQKDDYIGICHYRRFFGQKKRILDENSIRDRMEGVDIIVPKMDHFAVSVYNQYQYSDAHNISDLDKLIEIVRKRYPDYSRILDEVMREKAFYPYNMMYMKKELFHQYCDWIFDILFELMRQIPYKTYIGQKKRVFGYLSERMLLIWIKKNNLRVRELDVVNTEAKVKMGEKIFRRINSYATVYMGIDLRKKIYNRRQ